MVLVAILLSRGLVMLAARLADRRLRRGHGDGRGDDGGGGRGGGGGHGAGAELVLAA